MKYFKKYFAVIIGILVFVVYLFTVAPSVVEIDSGELATVQATLGIAHPTGYPLFTMLGYLFSLINFPFSKIYQLNILASVWCSLGAGLFTYTSQMILDNIDSFKSITKSKVEKIKSKKDLTKPEKSKQNLNKKIPEIKKYITSGLAGLLIAFDKTYWTQSTSVEVYSLQIFLFILVIFFSLRAFIGTVSPDKINLKNKWIWVAFGLALAFSNHMTTLFLLPGLAYLYFDKYKFTKKSFAGIGVMLLFFIPLISAIYLYLPIRATQNPALNWGDPTTLSRFFRHVEANQYRVWLFSSFQAAGKQLNYFILNLPSEFKVSLFICLVGLITAFIRARKLFIFLLITFLFTVLYSVNYNIKDIDSYFLLAYLSLGFFGLFGIVQLFSLLKAQKFNYIIPVGLVAIFILVQSFLNYKQVNQSDVYTFKDYTTNILKNCSGNSVILSYQWDYLISPSYYFQYVEHYRQDITVVDKELLRRSWYYKQLSNDHPRLFRDMKNDIDGFLKAVAPFESGNNYDANEIEMYYRKILTDIVAKNINSRDVYIAPELFENEMQRGEFALPEGYTLVPDLFLFKVEKGKKYISAKDPDFTIRFPAERNQYTRMIENFIGSMLARRALYEMQYDKVEKAKLYIKKIKDSIPDYALPPGIAEVIGK